MWKTVRKLEANSSQTKCQMSAGLTRLKAFRENDPRLILTEVKWWLSVELSSKSDASSLAVVTIPVRRDLCLRGCQSWKSILLRRYWTRDISDKLSINEQHEVCVMLKYFHHSAANVQVLYTKCISSTNFVKCWLSFEPIIFWNSLGKYFWEHIPTNYSIFIFLIKYWKTGLGLCKKFTYSI